MPEQGVRPRARLRAVLVASLALALAAPALPAVADEIEQSREREASTAAQIGELEAQLAAASATAQRLMERLGAAVEGFNGSRVRLAEARAAARGARAEVRRARMRVAAARVELGRFASAAYQSGGDLNGLALVAAADHPDDLMRRASALASIGDSRRAVLDDLLAAQAHVRSLERRADRALQRQRRAADRMAEAKQLAEQRVSSHAESVAALDRERDGLIRELAAARDTTVRLERARQDRIEREREAAAAAAAEAKAREDARKAEEARRAEETRRAEEARRAEEEARRAEEEAQRQEDARREEESARAATPGPGPTPSPTVSRAEPSPTPTPTPTSTAAQRPPAEVPQPPSGATEGTPAGAEAAIAYARAQLGKPYRWGADGPESFDCSGLTMRAWQQGGVALPHHSVSQYADNLAVPLTELRPGDLVFFASNPASYRSIYHVGLYLGSGQMVEAPYTGESVRISSIWRSSLFGAARP